MQYNGKVIHLCIAAHHRWHIVFKCKNVFVTYHMHLRDEMKSFGILSFVVYQQCCYQYDLDNIL